MKAELVNRGDLRTYVCIFDAGDEMMSGLTSFARREGLDAARFTAIGAFSDALLAFFDWETKDYVDIPVDQQVEVLSLLGDIARKDGEVVVHAHAVVGEKDGTTRGGHVKRATVRPTLEVVVDEAPAHLRRVHDEQSGLALIRPADDATTVEARRGAG